MKQLLSSITQRVSSTNVDIIIDNWHIQAHQRTYIVRFPFGRAFWHRPTAVTVTPPDTPSYTIPIPRPIYPTLTFACLLTSLSLLTYIYMKLNQKDAIQ